MCGCLHDIIQKENVHARLGQHRQDKINERKSFSSIYGQQDEPQPAHSATLKEVKPCSPLTFQQQLECLAHFQMTSFSFINYSLVTASTQILNQLFCIFN